MYKDVHLWRGGSRITSAPLVPGSSNFWSAAEKRYANSTEKAHFYGAQGETSPSLKTKNVVSLPFKHLIHNDTDGK